MTFEILVALCEFSKFTRAINQSIFLFLSIIEAELEFTNRNLSNSSRIFTSKDETNPNVIEHICNPKSLELAQEDQKFKPTLTTQQAGSNLGYMRLYFKRTKKKFHTFHLSQDNKSQFQRLCLGRWMQINGGALAQHAQGLCPLPSSTKKKSSSKACVQVHKYLTLHPAAPLT